jgi:hypothetical protein
VQLNHRGWHREAGSLSRPKPPPEKGSAAEHPIADLLPPASSAVLNAILLAATRSSRSVCGPTGKYVSCGGRSTLFQNRATGRASRDKQAGTTFMSGAGMVSRAMCALATSTILLRLKEGEQLPSIWPVSIRNREATGRNSRLSPLRDSSPTLEMRGEDGVGPASGHPEFDPLRQRQSLAQ